MQRIGLNIDNIVRALLPWYKRKPLRLAWLTGLASPLTRLWTTFAAWRREMRLMMRVTAQVKVLEGYLQERFGDGRILVETYDEQGLAVGLESEGDTHLVAVPLPSEGDGVMVALQGEMRAQWGDADFMVYVPQGVDPDAVRAAVERFKIAGIKFKIKQI